MSNIVSLILRIASFGLFFGYVDPTYTNVQKLGQDKADYDKALSNSKELQAERDKLLEQYNKMDKDEVSKLSKLLPDNIDNIRLIIDIDEMAKNYKMRIRNFKTDATSKSDTIGRDNTPYGTLTLSFTTTAPYNTFLAFLHDLERSLRVLDVTGVQFSVGNQQNQIYDYNVTVKTYWLK
ncbi:MAG TPA: type 4a pilus biogenesis protein PilO [Candidatus Paceibacterota bacterium]|nr:type 4a pilus biogenesis protein PilO [Candidatus Paceibacterota bacterium]